MYKKSIIEFAKKELNNEIMNKDHQGIFSWDNWEKCSNMGMTGLLIPEEYGGMGLDLTDTIRCIKALSYACKDSGLVHAIITQNCCGLQILLFGNDLQKKEYLFDISAGKKIAAQAITESDSGSDVKSIRTTVEKDKDRYILNGTKMYISNGPIADLIIVFAADESKRDKFGGISSFIIENGVKGFHTGKPLEKMGLRTLQNSELILNDCNIPIFNLLGRENQGLFIFNEVIEWERALMSACHLGTMERIFKTCVKYAKGRRQFGKPIGKFQSISNKIADMKINIELGRLMLSRIGLLKDQKKRATLETSIGKLFISESLKKMCIDAIQIHGAYGFMKDAEIERDLRDSIAATIYSGTSEIQRNIISSIIGV